MNYIEPKPLTKGDTIEFIAPAGPIRDKDAIKRARLYFEKQGFNVKYSKHLFNQYNYLSDNDDNRLEDLHNAFLDKDVDAINCGRGGYGCLRLIDKIDYNSVNNILNDEKQRSLSWLLSALKLLQKNILICVPIISDCLAT